MIRMPRLPNLYLTTCSRLQRYLLTRIRGAILDQLMFHLNEERRGCG